MITTPAQFYAYGVQDGRSPEPVSTVFSDDGSPEEAEYRRGLAEGKASLVAEARALTADYDEACQRYLGTSGDEARERADEHTQWCFDRLVSFVETHGLTEFDPREVDA